MKTASDQLFRLVKSLDMNELRYLTLFAAQFPERKGGRLYLQLLRLIRKQEQYNEAEIRRQMPGTDARSFKRLKHYAFETTLRSLENYHASLQPETQILRKFMQAEILLRKKQYDALRRCIAQARRLCMAHDRLVFLPVCDDWEMRCVLLEPRRAPRKKILLNELQDQIDEFARWQQLRFININAWQLINREAEPNASEIREIRRWIKTAAELVPKKNPGYTVYREFTQINSVCYRLLGDWENSLKYRKLMLDRLESEAEKLNDRAYEYITILNNTFVAAMNLGRDNLEIYTDKASRFYAALPSSAHTQRVSDTYINLVNNHAGLLLKKSRYDEAYTLCRKVREIIEKHRYTFSNWLVALYLQHITVAAFYTGEWREAQRHHHRLEQYYSIPRAELLLLGLVIYYTRRDEDLVMTRVRKIKRSIRQLPEDAALLKIFCTAFSTTLLRSFSKQERAAAFADLAEQIGRDKKLSDRMKTYTLFDFGSWLKNQSKGLRENA